MALRKETAGVKAVKAVGFEGFDHTLESKIKHPERYGIMPVATALKALEAAGVELPPYSEAKPHRAEHRAKPNRLVCRVDNLNHDTVKQAFLLSPHKTMQEFVEAAVLKYAAELLQREREGWKTTA